MRSSSKSWNFRIEPKFCFWDFLGRKISVALIRVAVGRMQRRGGNAISFGEPEKPSVSRVSGRSFADTAYATGITITITILCASFNRYFQNIEYQKKKNQSHALRRMIFATDKQYPKESLSSNTQYQNRNIRKTISQSVIGEGAWAMLQMPPA